MCTYHSPWRANFLLWFSGPQLPCFLSVKFSASFPGARKNSEQEVKRCCFGARSRPCFLHSPCFLLLLWPPLPHHLGPLTHCPRASLLHQFFTSNPKTQRHKCQWALHFRADILSADKFYAAVVFLQPRLKTSKSGIVLSCIAFSASHKSSTDKSS